MPELPDVEVFRRHLSATSLHQEIAKASSIDAQIIQGVSPTTAARRLKGQSFETTKRHGKYLFVQLSREGWLVLHFGMTGYLQHLGEEEPPRHTRALIEFKSGDHLAYVCQRKLGRITFADSLDQFLADHDLGPDALDVSQKVFCESLSAKNSTVKAALMDQAMIAGVGNVYSDEILFHSRLHPSSRTEKIDDQHVKDLFRAMQRVLKEAIKRHAQPDEMPPSFLLPHRKDLGPCPRCHSELKKQKIAGRSAVFCPKCQAKS